MILLLVKIDYKDMELILYLMFLNKFDHAIEIDSYLKVRSISFDFTLKSS